MTLKVGAVVENELHDIVASMDTSFVSAKACRIAKAPTSS
jgi:hypothetical protein